MSIRIDGRAVEVENAITRFVTGGAIEGRVTRRSGDAIALTWTLRPSRAMARAQLSRLLYTAVITLPDGRFTATMRAPPGRRVFNGSGTCRRR